MSQAFADGLFLFSLATIWSLLLYSVVLAACGYSYWSGYEAKASKLPHIPDEELPSVSILIPARNEARVINRTLIAMGMLNYPRHKMQVIVVDDGSRDGTDDIVDKASIRFPFIRCLRIPPHLGGRGKASALNFALSASDGDVVVVYDADNTPEPDALRRLIRHLVSNPGYGAVVGKFRVTNKDANLLTRFINLETLGFQWLAQAGRAKLLGVVTIPGTNFAIWRRVLDQVDAWDDGALAEDTELSIRVYQAGYSIGLVPDAVTWEEEPETLRVWLRQRNRWVRGNVYVISKYMAGIRSLRHARIAFDLLHMFAVYFLFLIAMLVSTILFILGILGAVRVSIQGPLNALWALGVVFFVVSMSISLLPEEDELNLRSVMLLLLMYFTYSQLWTYVAIRGISGEVKDRFLGVKAGWYKTERRG